MRWPSPSVMQQPSSTPVSVLFVCTHNSARSQLTEAMLGHLGGDAVEAHSAGTEATRVNPFAIAALADLGINWSDARSKVIDEFLGRRFDYVITVCGRANETCPYFPGSAHRLHWGLEDPSLVGTTDEERLAAFRATRDEITERLAPFLAEVLAGRQDGGAPREGSRPQAFGPQGTRRSPMTSASGRVSSGTNPRCS